MADARKLKRFVVDEDAEGFRLEIEDQAGVVFTVSATHEQLDLIADSLDDILGSDEWSDGSEDGEAPRS